MDAWGRRRFIVASIVAAGLLVVAAIGTTAFFMIRAQQRSDDVDQAARVASAFNRKVSTYRSSVQSALTSSDTDNAKQVKAAFDAAVVKTPRLGDAPEWGRTHSTTYLRAVKTEKTLKEPYEAASTVLDEAIIGQPFIQAANAALAVDIDRFVKAKALPNGGQIRAELIPGFEKVLATFDKVAVPKGQESVALKVRTALKAVLKDAEKAADELDSGRSTSISAQSDYVAAGSAVIAYERSLEARIDSAIAEAAAVVSGQPTESVT
jgi:hypothetical protein